MRRSTAPSALTVLLAALAGTVAAPPSPAQAVSAPATFTVDSAEDAVDADASDGICRTATGTCTLRAAVMAANARPGSTIELPAARYRLTIPPNPDHLNGRTADPTTGDLNILEPTTILGAGARKTIIDANHVDRVFRMGADTSLSDLTITGGDAKQREVPITDPGGGGIANSKKMTLRRVTVTGNRAGYGGGIFNIPGSHLTLIESTVSRNTAGEAGGIRFDDTGTVVNSTIADNRVTDDWDRPGSLSGYGGGIDIRGRGLVDIRNSTITGNTATDGGGGINIAPAYLDSLPGPITDPINLPLGHLALQNTIIAKNTIGQATSDCKNVFATIESRGNNLDSGNSCHLTAEGDLPSRDPRLAPLGDYGGPTDTVALLPDSPALDTASDCPSADQRGVLRPQGPACDIGAFEYRR
ncbi:right-handed parallel beta-helix repeat-containing protein [Streptomyces sp. WMMC940]|uniref:right-handed parallel beta-helix repeat-containing protein n=1 Tax=Streptomyces sp. WMMC940 TaxID=3015153 RepID=UPI0022B6E6D1|nr:right-handed parallel beta-helix repeat-containing protein [Streptomyces sp. WMMC940]MCZ7462299.1 right-handed parallel beta-helix repeat-containing protein [Streptomyces sp. WMMC940]